MVKQKYSFTDYDLKYRCHLEEKRGTKIPDEEFYRYIQKLRKWLEEYVKVVKKWAKEKPWEAEQLTRLVDSWKEKEKNKDLYEKLAKIKRLTVIELEKLLTPLLEKESYIHLRLANPEIDRNVVVPFTVQDSKSGRENRTNEYDLKRLFKKVLEDTNWRLMSDGVSYRLGVLTGRLKGYEREEDLIKLVKVIKDE